MIVEDDKKLGKLIKNHLERYNYNIVLVEDFSNVICDFLRSKPQLVLLDINLPYFDGFYWCTEIRRKSKVPIIFISARDSDMDQVMAIENGADDFIIKPLSYDLLLAKIKGVLRRVYGSYSNLDTDIIDINGLKIYINKSLLEYKDKKIELSKNEFLLVNEFLKNPNKIISRNELLDILWSDTDFIDDNTLSVNITRVRKKLESIGIKDAINTRRGQGYMFTDSWK